MKKQSLTQEDTIKEFQEKIRTAEEQNTGREESEKSRSWTGWWELEYWRKAEEEAKLAELGESSKAELKRS